MRVLKMGDDALSLPRARRFSFAGGNDERFPPQESRYLSTCAKRLFS
jgi:hypothetical protein